MQKSIEDFFINQSKKNDSTTKTNLKKYFYLSWSEKNRPNSDAYWTDDKPEKINFIEKVDCSYMKKGFYFFICGYFIDNEEKSILRDSQIYKNIHLLKSHLQKSIRKKNGNLTVQSCYHLMKLDLNELLRRIPIIMLEDTMLHESVSTIIWLMIANSLKTFKMKNYIYEWILGFVYVLSQINKKDNDDFDSEENESNKNNIKNELLLTSYHSLENTSQISILYSLHLRIAYGGMDSDLKMINKFINLWQHRFTEAKINIKINNKDVGLIIKTIIKPISLLIQDMNIEDWDLSAIDYHCHPKFLTIISKKYPDIPEEELRKIIWNYSSGINNRVKRKEYNIEKWNEIKEHVLKTQKYLLDSSY